jgi:hypothetical protein
MSTAWRWIGAATAIVVAVAIAIGISAASVLSSLVLDRVTLVIDGEQIVLPSLSGWQAALAATTALLAVLLATLVAIAIAFGATVFGVAAASIAVLLTLLLVASPLLLIGWIVRMLWLLARRASRPKPAVLSAA